MLFSVGGLSAFLMNDTLAIIGTPLVLHYASRQKVSPKLLLLALAFAVTIGSAMSPIGNPQNLLIALDGGIVRPLRGVLLPLAGADHREPAPGVRGPARLFYRSEFQKGLPPMEDDGIKDPALAMLVQGRRWSSSP